MQQAFLLRARIDRSVDNASSIAPALAIPASFLDRDNDLLIVIRDLTLFRLADRIHEAAGRARGL
jgi:hypothetical protein